MSLWQFQFEKQEKVYNPISKEAFVEVGADEYESLVQMLQSPEQYAFLKNDQEMVNPFLTK